MKFVTAFIDRINGLRSVDSLVGSVNRSARALRARQKAKEARATRLFAASGVAYAQSAHAARVAAKFENLVS